MQKFAFFQLPMQISGLMSFFSPSSKWLQVVYQGAQVSLCALLLACVPQPQPVPTVSASVSLTPTVSPSVPISTPSPLVEKRADGRFCAPMEPSASKPSLKYPIDLAVSPDGQDIYIVTKRCQDDVSQKPGLSSFTFPDCGAEADSSHVIPRSYIYHLHQGQGLEILKIYNQPPLSCELGEDIEMDSQGRLYVTTPYNHRVYRLDPKQNKLEQVVEARQKKLLPSTSTKTEEILRGPTNLFVREDEVYFLLSDPPTVPNGEKDFTVINPNNRHIIISNFPFGIYQGSPIFMVTGAEKLLYLYEPESIYYDTPRINVVYSPYPSSLTTRLRGGWRSFVFDPSNPIVSTKISAPRNPILGDLKIDDKTNIYASHPSWNRILELPDSNSMGSAQEFVNNLIIFAGSGEPGLKDGGNKDAQFRFPMGLSLDTKQNLYVADMGNHAIRKITPEGIVTTLYAEQR